MSSNKDSFNVADLSTALNAEDRADLVNALKNKLQDLAGKHSDVLENLSPNSQHDDLEAKFFEERAALEAKYQKLYQPLYTKAKMVRECLISIWNIILMMGLLSLSFSNLAEKGVPDFWLTAMKNNEVLAEEISERDEGALKFLKDIKWSRIDNPKGTEIEWYPGKCLTQKILKKKPKKGSKNAKPITKTEQCESFFNFFSPPQVPDEDDDIDEDAAEELQNLMEQDYDIG
ncbi:UNVERIFIED_CONTAM: Nucleosome assembly protein 1 [Sesamum angustifolium]|uniref:Nucleosome assembly protein 1 n=1 Tax=Sesamum angustifolium TaxID=2727405 RepID=A0AAW2MUN8_9LAMI